MFAGMRICYTCRDGVEGQILRRRRPQAFSLSEVLIALLILSLLSVLMLGVIPATIIGLASANQKATASFLAAQTLAEVRQQDPFRLYTLAPSFAPSANIDGSIYEVLYGVYDNTGLPKESASAAPTSLSVEVVIRWHSKQGIRFHRVRSIVSRT